MITLPLGSINKLVEELLRVTENSKFICGACAKDSYTLFCRARN